MPTKKLTKLIALVLITTGIISLYIASKAVIKRNTPVNFETTNTQLELNNAQNYPVFIDFQQLQLHLPITPKSLTNGKWEDPDASVGYWIDSPIPGQKGNSVMYGHNWTNILEKLPKTTKGDSITIGFADGTTQTFEVADTYIVSADQTHILNQTDDTRLTIYTCTGFLDFKRFVVVAVPIDTSL